MESLINYFIQVHLILAAGYGVYHLLLKKQRWFTFNRLTLLFIPVLAFIAPLLRIPVPSNSTAEVFRINLALVDVAEPSAQSVQMMWFDVLAALYFIVAVFLLFRLFFQLTRIALMSRGEKTESISVSEIPGSSFSFFGRIFLNNNLDPHSRKMILAHEMI